MSGKGIERSQAVGSSDLTGATPPEANTRTGTRLREHRATGRAGSQPAVFDALARNRTRTEAGTRSSAGRTATLPRQTALAESSTSPDEVKNTVDMALQFGRAWQSMAGGEGVSDVDEALNAADMGMASARRGIDALDRAKQMGLNPPEHAKAEMIGFVLQAAEFAIVALHNQLEVWNRNGFIVDEPDLTPAAQNRQQALGKHDAPQPSQSFSGRLLPPSAEAAVIGTVLAEICRKRDKLGAYEKIAQEFPAWLKAGGNHTYLQQHEMKMKLSRRLAQSVTRGMNARILDLNIARLKVSGFDLVAVLERSGENTIRQIDDKPELHKAWDDIDKADDLDPDQLDDAKAVVIPYLHGINVLSDELCLEAADKIEANDESGLWRYALDMAGAFKNYASYLRGLCDEARAGRPRRPRDELAAPQASALSRPDGSSSSRARQTALPHGATQPRQDSAAAKPTVAEPRPAPGLTEHSAEASAAAARPRVNYRAIAERAGGDVISIAHELGKDAPTLESMRGPMYDPVDAAHFARKSAESWLGETGKLRKAIGRARASAPANENRIEELSDRLEALKLIQGNIAATESDAIKRLARPEEKHLKQLLQLKAIKRVGPPVRLPSEGDVGDTGTLFELTVELKPFSNGEPARPLFVHLHTSRLVNSEGARTLAFKALTAVHVKTAAQRSLGAKWEQIANASGAVHRGKIHSASLLGELRAFRPQPE